MLAIYLLSFTFCVLIVAISITKSKEMGKRADYLDEERGTDKAILLVFLVGGLIPYVNTFLSLLAVVIWTVGGLKRFTSNK